MRERIDLETALYIIIRLGSREVPYELRTLMLCPDGCERERDFTEWFHKLTEQVIEFAANRARANRTIFRTPCPLCGDTPTGNAEQTGYSIPEGLGRHLDGAGRSPRCDVMEAAAALVLARHKDQWAVAASEERAQAVAQREARLQSGERRYLIEPGKPPVLFDEGHFFGHPLRDADGMTWAETRLRGLGFEVQITDGNVVAYRYLYADVDVLADPRLSGNIEIRVCRRTRPPCIHFSLQDRWTTSLEPGFKDRLARAMAELAKPKRKRQLVIR